MAHELDDIRANDDCPACGRTFTVSYKTLRLGRSVECQGCGETIRLEDGTPIGAIQRLIDEAQDDKP
jgi:DNA-directed RNA polymerase subunit RPC12/RpoP